MTDTDALTMQCDPQLNAVFAASQVTWNSVLCADFILKMVSDLAVTHLYTRVIVFG